MKFVYMCSLLLYIATVYSFAPSTALLQQRSSSPSYTLLAASGGTGTAEKAEDTPFSVKAADMLISSMFAIKPVKSYFASKARSDMVERGRLPLSPFVSSHLISSHLISSHPIYPIS